MTHARRSAGLLLPSMLLGACSTISNEEIQTVRQHVGGWTIEVREDRFAGLRHCKVRSRDGRMAYQPGAIGFRVRSRDSMAAFYRIDDGPPVRWTDRYPTLLAAGIEVGDPDLDDSTGGLVWIPRSELVGARSVRIRAGDAGRSMLFMLDGSDAAITASEQMGCRTQPGAER